MNINNGWLKINSITKHSKIISHSFYSDNISEHRKQHQNWSNDELEASLRLKWNCLKKKDKTDHMLRIQRIPHLPRLGNTLRELSGFGRFHQWRGDDGCLESNLEPLNPPGKCFELATGSNEGPTFDKSMRKCPQLRQQIAGLSFLGGKTQRYEKRKEFNLKTLFTSPAAIKKQIIKLIRQRIACAHCFLGLRKFLNSKLDESWERCIIKTNQIGDLPQFPQLPGKMGSISTPGACNGSYLKDSLESAVIQLTSSGRIAGMAEEKRRLKRLWSGRVWKMIEDLVEIMEMEISKRKNCQCRHHFRLNPNDGHFFIGGKDQPELKCKHEVVTEISVFENPPQTPERVESNFVIKDEAQVALEILESWTKEGRERRMNSSTERDLNQVSVADEQVIKEIKCSLMEFGEMVSKDKNIFQDDPLFLEISRHLKAQGALDGDQSPAGMVDPVSCKSDEASKRFQQASFLPLRNHPQHPFDGCHDNGSGIGYGDGLVASEHDVLCGRFHEFQEKEMADGNYDDVAVRMFQQAGLESQLSFNNNNNHHHHHHHHWMPRYQLQLSRTMTPKTLRAPHNANNLFLDSCWGLSQRSQFLLPSVINTRPSPNFLTIKPPALPPMPPLPPTPPPSSGSGFYHVDNEFRSAHQDADASGFPAEKQIGDTNRTWSKNDFGVKQNQFFLKLSMKNPRPK